MDKNQKEKIVLIQPGYAHYRNQLFNILSNAHRIHVLYEKTSNIYPGEVTPGNYSHSFLERILFSREVGLIFYLLKNRPDIVISSISVSYRSIISYFYAMLFKKRFILWIIEWREHLRPKSVFKNKIRVFKFSIGRKLIRRCHALIVGGSASKNYAISLEKSENDIFLAIQCADDLSQKYNMKRLPKKHANAKYKFLYMSRIVPHKGLDLLIQAFSMLREKRKDVSLIIGGDGPFRERCEKLAKSINTQDIHFIGAVAPKSVHRIFENADVFILPCHFENSVYEAWGLVVNEAMSMGLPVITTKAVGASYDMLVDGLNGLIAKDNDVNDLFKMMDKILFLNLTKMGQNSRSIFERKNQFINMANGFSQAIDHVLEK